MINETNKSNWNELRGKIKSQWSKLSDDDIDSAKNGSYDALRGHVQKTYGLSKEKAEEELTKFKNSAAARMRNIADKAEHRRHDE